MPNQDLAPIDVSLESTASDEDLQAVAALFDEFGLRAAVQANYLRKAEGPLPWLVNILTPANVFVGAFALAVIKRFADDMYDAARRLVVQLWRSRKQHAGPEGNVVLHDDELHVRLLLEEDLPAEAYQALARLDPREVSRKGTLHYDRARDRWRPLSGNTE